MSLRLVFRKARAHNPAKRGTYYIEGTDHEGRRVHESLKTGDRDLAKAEFAKRTAQTLDMRKRGPMGVANFANAVALYLEHKPDTSNNVYLSEMLDHIGEKRLTDITQKDLDDLAKKMRPKGSPATRVRHVYTPFTAVWNAAVDHDPPLAVMKRWKKPRVPDHEAAIPSEEEIGRLVAQARKGRNALRDEAAILFLTLTGTRTGEAWKLRVGDVDLERATALLRRVKATSGKVRQRQVALTPELVKALTLQIERLNGQTSTSVFEFETRWGMPQMIARHLSDAGLPPYRPHEIGRHAFASRLLRSGASLLDVVKAGGWEDARMVIKFYGHLAKEQVDGLVSRQKVTPKQHPISENLAKPAGKAA